MAFKERRKRGAFGSKRNAAPPVAIDFGVSALRVLQVGAGDPTPLIAAAQIMTPPELLTDAGRRLQWQLQALPELIRSSGIKAQRAVCNIPAGQMLCKHFQIQRAQGLSLSVLVQAAIGAQMNCDQSALLCRHTEVADIGQGRAEVICFATSRDLVDRLMQGIKAAKLEPVGIHTEHAAMIKAMSSAPESDDTPTLLIDLGRATTKICLTKGSEMLFARVVDAGGIDLDRAVAEQTGLSLAEAEKVRLGFNDLTNAEVPCEVQGGQADDNGAVATATRRVDLTIPLEVLTDEVSMCLRYAKGLFPADAARQVVFVGGDSRHRGLCAHIARSVRLPAKAADPMARLYKSGGSVSGVNFDSPQPGWTVALGMCLSPTDL